MQFRNLDWDDFRLVLAIGRGGGLAPAGRLLGVNHATAFRRVNALEAKLRAALFERHRSGYSLTALGEAVFHAAERMEDQVIDFDRAVAGEDLALQGSIRLTAPDDVIYHLLLPILRDFRERYPGLSLEVIVDNRFLSLTRREADIALRSTNAPPDSMVGVNVGTLASGVYAARQLAGKDKPIWPDLPWIGWDEGSAPKRFADWYQAQLPPKAVIYRSNSLLNQAGAVRAGIGAGLLPCFLGDGDPALTRLAGPAGMPASDLWILTHADLRRAARITAFMDFVGGALRMKRKLLAGRAN